MKLSSRLVSSRVARSSLGAVIVLAAAAVPACSSEPDALPPDTPLGEVASVQQAAEANPGDCDIGFPSDTLTEYAAKCDKAIGISVPAFNCEAGTLVPTNSLTPTNAAYLSSNKCDAPNVLNSKCDPGSKFQVLKRTAEAVIVAHCRHKGGARQANGENLFGDIAVIQYNKRTGATCFYQSQVSGDPFEPITNLTASVPAPSDTQASAAWGNWLQPKDAASLKCVECHDNGPFIRSPYLAQLRDEPFNRLPGTNGGPNPGPFDNRLSWNKTEPYKFVGNDFQGWKAYSVSVQGTGSECTSCHRLGISSRDNVFTKKRGTALDFGLRSTATGQVSKNPHSAAAPIWMKVDQVTYNSTSAGQASAVAKCANQQIAYGNSPIAANRPDPNCGLVRYAQGDTCYNAPITAVINGETSGPVTTGRVETVVPLGSAPDSTDGGTPGICYYTILHGPFWQATPAKVPQSDLKFRGSSLVIAKVGGQWAAKAFIDSGTVPRAAPGGKVECTAFSDFRKLTGPASSWNNGFLGITGDGQTALTQEPFATSYPAYPWAFSLFGIGGNVAQFQFGTTGSSSDYLKMDYSNGKPLLSQLHSLTPPPPLQVGAFQATMLGFGAPTDPNGWAPNLVVRDVFTTSDVQLLPANNTKARRCFISGLSGAWSTDSLVGTVQPSAKIYLGPANDIRLKVVPGSSDPKFTLGAYASCVALDQ